jgi:hypothetical protein
MAKYVLKTVVEAHIHSECADGFDHARIKITKALAARILELREGLLKLKANFIHEYDYTPELLEKDYSRKDERFKATETSVECEQLVVCDDSFWWEGMLKNGNEHWDTDAIYIEDLEVALIPPHELPTHIDRVWKREQAKALFLKRLAAESRVAA